MTQAKRWSVNGLPTIRPLTDAEYKRFMRMKTIQEQALGLDKIEALDLHKFEQKNKSDARAIKIIKVSKGIKIISMVGYALFSIGAMKMTMLATYFL